MITRFGSKVADLEQIVLYQGNGDVKKPSSLKCFDINVTIESRDKKHQVLFPPSVLRVTYPVSCPLRCAINSLRLALYAMSSAQVSA